MQARRQGVHCIAVTAWALLGSYYWNQFVTSENGHYEPGVFDVRSGEPVATELAQLWRKLPTEECLSTRRSARPGWWRQSSRLCFPQSREKAA